MWYDTCTHFDEIIEQRQRALRALRIRLGEPAKLDEGDLFATSLLALHFFRLGNCHEGMKHVQGFFSIMHYLFARAGGARGEYILAMFWSLATDDTMGWYFYEGNVFDSATVLGLSNIQESQKYYLTLEVPLEVQEQTNSSCICLGDHFLHLQGVYLSAAGIVTGQAVNFGLVEIQAFVDDFNEEFLYQCFLPTSFKEWNGRGSKALFVYHFCYIFVILLSVILQHGKIASQIFAATRLFESFRRIECMVDQCQFLGNGDVSFEAGKTQPLGPSLKRLRDRGRLAQRI